MSKLVILIAAAIFAWFSLAVPSGSVLVAEVSSVQIFGYDGHHSTSHVPAWGLERGPPATDERATTSKADVARSHGASAHPDGHASRVETSYDVLTMLVRTARATGTSRVPYRAVDRALSASVLSGVAAKSADDLPILSGIVRDAATGKGNFGVGSGTASQATPAGESWVGECYRIASDGKTLVSRDGLPTFRPPSWKPGLGKYQANFSYWIGERVGKPFGNGHLDTTDMGP